MFINERLVAVIWLIGGQPLLTCFRAGLSGKCTIQPKGSPQPGAKNVSRDSVTGYVIAYILIYVKSFQV